MNKQLKIKANKVLSAISRAEDENYFRYSYTSTGAHYIGKLSDREKELIEYVQACYGFLLNTSEYRHKKVSFLVMAELISRYYTSDRADFLSRFLVEKHFETVDHFLAIGRLIEVSA